MKKPRKKYTPKKLESVQRTTLEIAIPHGPTDIEKAKGMSQRHKIRAELLGDAYLADVSAAAKWTVNGPDASLGREKRKSSARGGQV
ncbi:MAG: hypothetical protein HQ514_17415, partial [Rhodospirillales bacterium]|nr:hypothetical protein [Rhodospirillales bacterium]